MRNILPRLVAIAVAVTVVLTALTATPATAAAQVQNGIGVGERVGIVPPDGLNARTEPGLDGEVIDTYFPGFYAYVAEGPVDADGYTWFRLEESGQDYGWVAGEFLTLVVRDGPPGPTQMVVIAEPSLNVRAEPGLDGEIISSLNYGALIAISGEEIVADGYTWHPLVNQDGWVASEFLSVPGTGGPDTPTPGTRVAVNTDWLNVRTEPGLGAAVVNVLPNGYEAFIVDGPVQADGYDWYQIEAMGQTLGWVAGDFLTVIVDDGGGLMEPGTAIVVTTDWLNFRDGFGLGAPIIDVLPYGTEATFLSYPAGGTDDGYDWYQIELTDGSVGWVAGEYVSRV